MSYVSLQYRRGNIIQKALAAWAAAQGYIAQKIIYQGKTL